LSKPGPVYIDFDDVLCETARALSGVADRLFGKGVPFEEIRFFDLKRSFNLSQEESDELSLLFHDGDLLASLLPVPGALEGVRAWRASGRELWIVTGRPPDTYAVSRDWLERYDVPFDRLVMVDKYGRGHAAEPAVPTLTVEELCAQDFELAVEDSLHMAGCLLERTTLPVVLLARPWNSAWQSLGGDGRLTRCANWAQVLASVG